MQENRTVQKEKRKKKKRKYHYNRLVKFFGCISIDRPFRTESIQYLLLPGAKTYTLRYTNQYELVTFQRNRLIYWTQQEFFCPFLSFNRDLGRYFSR